MKTFVSILFYVFLTSITHAHMAHYKDFKKIEMEIFRNGKLIGYSNYSFSRKGDETIIVGNLPFNISSQLLINWISQDSWPPFYTKMYLMFQKELGKRITSEINSKRYGKLSVLTQSRCNVKEVIEAPSKIFHPKPKVDGIVLEFTPIDTYIDVKMNNLNQVLKSAFENRRKKIKNSLSEYSMYFDNWEKEQNLRPENLDVEKYCFLAKNIE